MKRSEKEVRKLPRTNDDALRAFISTMTEIQSQLPILTRYVDNHMEELPENIDWGHVGSAGRVLEMLAEANQFLNLK